MKKRLIALLFLGGFLCSLAFGGLPLLAQIPQEGLTITACKAAGCCAVPVPSTASAVLIYGFHVTNTSGSTVYVQPFTGTATPTASATPIGGVSWNISSTSDRDMQVGGDYGWVFNSGAMFCCSSVQSTFTSTNCNFLMQSR
jgi:hypothetical protein